MTTATAPATAQKVHIEVPGFQAFGEFHGSNKDCSADAELMARHPLDGSPLDAATLNLWWGEYWNTGHHTSGGATLDHIYWHLTGSAHKLDPKNAKVAKYIGTDKIPLAQLRTEIIAALTKGQTVITYLGAASAGLAYNERGVNGHFIALGGIDSDQGYLVGNGDDVNALGGKGIIPCRWYGWNSLAAAQVNGMIALEKVGTGMATAGVPSGWTDDGTTLKAPDGTLVVQGFREWVLAHDWAANNTPMAKEQVISSGSIEPGNVAVGPGSRQDFRFTSLGWTEKWGVYEIAVGQDLKALEQQLADAQARIKALEAQLATALANVGDPKAAALVAAIRAVLA